MLPIALSAAVNPGWSHTIATAALYLLAELVTGQAIEPMLYGGWFDGAIVRTETMEEMAKEFHGWWPMVLHAFTSLPLYLAIAGVATAWVFFIHKP